MALKVKAVERLLKFSNKENDPGVYRYVLKPDLYTSLSQAKVIKEAALRSGVSRGVMQACWDAAGEVIKAWATEGHSVALPGLGSMRFGLRSKAVEKVEDVKTGLIETRRIGGGREDRPHRDSTYHLHPRRGSEGRVEEHRDPDYLYRPQRQGGEACDFQRCRQHRGSRERLFDGFRDREQW